MSGVDRTSGRFGEPTPKRGSIVDAIETILLFPLGCLYAAERIFRPIGIRFPRLQIGTRYGAIPVALTYIALFLIAAAPAFYLGLSDVPAFNSPDEANGYITATMFAEHGRLYFQDELTEMSLERFPVGPRTFVQINGRGATQYPLGHPLTAGILHKLFGGAAPLVFAIVPGLTVLTLALLLRALVPTAPAYLGFTFIGTAPIWYWLSRLYMNVALELLFVSVGLLCFTLAIRRRSLWWFFGGSSGFALAALVRHPEAPMLLIVGLVFIIGMIRCFPPFQWGRTLQVAGVYAIPQVLFLVIPVAVTSWLTYGTPLTIGYLALYDNVAQERLPSDGNALLAPIKYFKLFFFPNPIEISVLWNIVRYQILFMLPIITGLGIAGALIARRTLVKTFGYPVPVASC